MLLLYNGEENIFSGLGQSSSAPFHPLRMILGSKADRLEYDGQYRCVRKFNDIVSLPLNAHKFRGLCSFVAFFCHTNLWSNACTDMTLRSFLSQALVGRANTSTAPLHGLRTLACLATILSHVESFAMLVLNIGESARIVTREASALSRLSYNILLTPIAASVDVFFFISGFVFANSFLSSDSKRLQQKQNLGQALKYVLNRWLRFFPVFVFASIVSMILLGGDNCIGWSQIAFLDRSPLSFGSNINVQTLCVGPAWTLHLDFYAHILMIVLSLLFTTDAILCKSLLCLVFLQPILRASFWISRKMPRSYHLPIPCHIGILKTEFIGRKLNISLGNYTKSPSFFEKDVSKRLAAFPLYGNFEFRYSSILVGTLTWYAMKNNVQIVRVIRGYQNRAICVAVLVWIFCMHGVYLYDTAEADSKTLYLIAYEAFAHTLVSVVTGIVTILCTTVEPHLYSIEDMSGIAKFLQRFLSSSWLVGFSRLTYAVYMTHFFSCRRSSLQDASCYHQGKLFHRQYVLIGASNTFFWLSSCCPSRHTRGTFLPCASFYSFFTISTRVGCRAAWRHFYQKISVKGSALIRKGCHQLGMISLECSLCASCWQTLPLACCGTGKWIPSAH